MATHKWEFKEIFGTDLPDESGSLDGTLINYDWFPSSDPEITNGEIYWANKIAANFDSKYIRISDPTGLNDLDEFTIHFYGTHGSNIGLANRTLMSRGGSISGWSFFLDNNVTFVWKQSGVADLSAVVPSFVNTDLDLFSVRRQAGVTELFLNNESVASTISGGSLPSGANGFDLLFHINEDEIDEPSDNEYRGVTDEIVFHTFAQTDDEIRDYWRSLEVTKPRIVGSVAYNTQESGSQLSIPVSTGYKENDTLFTYITVNLINPTQTINPTITVPTGWNIINVDSLNNSTNLSHLYSKTVTGIEPSGYMWSVQEPYDLAGMMFRIIGDKKTTDSADRPFFHNDYEFYDGSEGINSMGATAKTDGVIIDDLSLWCLIFAREWNPTDPLDISGITNIQNATLYFEKLVGNHYFALLEMHEQNQSNFDFVINEDSQRRLFVGDIVVARTPEQGSFFQYEVLPSATRGLFNSLVGL